MAVKNGFKLTEAGLITEDWAVKQIQEVCGFIVPGRNKPKHFDGNIPWITTPDLVDGRKVYKSRSSLMVSRDEAKSVGSKIVPIGSVIMTCVGELGIVAIAGCDIVINQQLHAFLPSNAINNVFLSYALKMQVHYMDSVATKTAVPYLNKDNCNSIPIPFPPLAEQVAIAEALSDADALIETLEGLLAKKRQVKQGAMQELLTGKKRLPGFGGKWEEKALGDLGEITGAGVDKKTRLNELPVRLVNYLDVYHKDFIYSKDLNHWVSAPSAQLKRCVVQKGDIFFTPSSEMPYDIAVSAIAMEDIPDAAYSYHVVRLRLNEDHNWNLVFRTYVFKTKYFLSQAETMCEGSGKRYVITLRRFRELKVHYPTDVKEQTAIAEILSNMDAEIAALEAKLAKARQVKQGMMQELLTGRVRLI